MRHMLLPISRTEICVPGCLTDQVEHECRRVGRRHSHDGLEPGDALLEGRGLKYETLESPGRALEGRRGCEIGFSRMESGRMITYRHPRTSSG